MKTVKRRAKSSIFTLILFVSYIPAYAQETFTGKQFMELPGEARDSYISVSIAMATFIATQTRDELATCIGYWYAPDNATTKQRNTEIIALIAEHDTYHPSSVILALIHDECGRFPSAE